MGQLAVAFNSMTDQLHGFIGSLEDQIQERTADLSVSMEVGQRAAAIRDLDELLPTITDFICEKFNLYHVQLYLMNDLRQTLILRSGTGAAGQEMLARRHSLPVDQSSIVGLAGAGKKAIMAPDARQHALFKLNPLLPRTRSQLAVPLIVDDQVIGVLDMQGEEIDSFSKETLTVFEAMATQLAIAIDGAQQWTAAQESQNRLEEVVGRLTQEAWAAKLAAQKGGMSMVYDLATVRPLVGETKNGESVSVPVVIQNETIGELAVETEEDRALTGDEQSLLAAVAQQLAQKAENIRLFEDTQQQAMREQLARQIMDKVRTSSDIESALRTAAAELSKALGTARAVVDLRMDPRRPEEKSK